MAGCANGRLDDLKDCAVGSVGVGVGLGADVKLGAITHPSIGVASYTRRVGIESRKTLGYWDQVELFFPYLNLYLFSMGTMDEETSFWRNVRGACATSYIQTTGGQAGYWLNYPREDYASGDRTSLFSEITDFQVGITLGVVSARLGVNPLEILDFLIGIIGFDIARDDTPAAIP